MGPTEKKHSEDYRRSDYKHVSAYLPHAVGKQEAHVVTHLSDERQSLLVVILRFTTEAWDEVTAETHV